MSKVGFVTGCSTGLGRHFVHAILDKGDRVIATARNLNSIRDLETLGAAILELDVTASEAVIKSKAREAIAIYGTVDVVLNNAGFLHMSAVEDFTSQHLAAQFDTNVFGTLKVTQAFLPHLRERGSGWILCVSSSTAFQPAPVNGAYVASKRAMEGLMAALEGEVKPFGIKVLVINPGAFRTEVLAPQRHNVAPSEPYEPLVSAWRNFLSREFEQVGDPKKLGRLIVDVVHGDGLAAGKSVTGRILAGSDVYTAAQEYCADVMDHLREWEDVIKSTDKDEMQQKVV